MKDIEFKSTASASTPCCALELAGNDEILAVVGSDKFVRILKQSSWQQEWLAQGHTDRINDICLPSTSEPYFFTVSEDSMLKVWDLRTRKEALSFQAEAALFSVGVSPSGVVVAAGGTGRVDFWDIREPGVISRSFSESFGDQDPVSQVHFVWDDFHVLTGSEDCLICLFDTRIPEEDDALLNVLNEEQPIARLAPFACDSSHLWCISTVHTLSIWDFQQADRLFALSDAREQLHSDCLFTCHPFSASPDRLVVFASKENGSLVVGEQKKARVRPLADLHDSQTSCITAAWCSRQAESGQWLVVTASDTGRICAWEGHPSSATEAATPSADGDLLDADKTTPRKSTSSAKAGVKPRKFAPY
mmetsp:Transcript_5131/g.8854  ORF Transcript_5131/g.8854 Transcript_5131/m.8854 type:complete len:361 (+) Transcript_5131:180-1262(+)